MRIDILIHAADEFGPNYVMFHIAEMWRKDGHSVRVVQGTQTPPNAELVILHTDITTVPIEYLAKIRQYPKSMNGYVADISKRLVSRNLVLSHDPYNGPVIVKTNFNCGGSQEAYFSSIGILPGIAELQVQNYQIFGSKIEVPAVVWQSRDWVVEKYLPEIDDGFYCLRTWSFLGDRWTHNRSLSLEQIVKGHNTVRRENIGEIPEELMALREELAFDYGKFDYGMVDGRVVLYDANRTPTLGIFTPEQYIPRIKTYAQGLAAFL